MEAKRYRENRKKGVEVADNEGKSENKEREGN